MYIMSEYNIVISSALLLYYSSNYSPLFLEHWLLSKFPKLFPHNSYRPIAELYKFHQRVQKEGESVVCYFALLHKLAEHYNFKEFLDQALHDKLVCGTWNEATQKNSSSWQRRVIIGMSLWNSKEYGGGTSRARPVISRTARTKCKCHRSQKYFTMLEVWQDGACTQPAFFPFKAVQEMFKDRPNS